MNQENERTSTPEKYLFLNRRVFSPRHQAIRSKKLRAMKEWVWTNVFKLFEVPVPVGEIRPSSWEENRKRNANKFFNYGVVYPEPTKREKPEMVLSNEAPRRAAPKRPKRVNRLSASRANAAARGERASQERMRSRLNEKSRRAILRQKRRERGEQSAASTSVASNIAALGM